jgi:DNA-directed RNA polymerase specialized sigma24 family protein
MSDFNHLLEEQIPRLRRYARALTSNIERADDLVQDTLVRALVKRLSRGRDHLRRLLDMPERAPAVAQTAGLLAQAA